MLRIVVQVLLALTIPVLLYMLWVVVRDGRPAPGWLRDAPWPAIVSSGVALLAVSLAALALFGGYGPEGEFVPAHVVDGEVVPSTFRK